MKIPVFLPVTREFGFRDEFAQDCLANLVPRRLSRLPVGTRLADREAHGPVIGHARVLVVDVGGKEFQEPARGMITGIGNGGRHRERAAQAGAYCSSPARVATPLRPCGDPRLRGAAAPYERGYSSTLRPASGSAEVSAVSGVAASGSE
jgi:hypothetical protein